jgi:hypothetical protein
MHITPDRFARLVARFDSMHYESLTWDRDCPAKHTTDHATIRTSIARRGKAASLDHNLGDGCAPQALIDLEKAI